MKVQRLSLPAHIYFCQITPLTCSTGRCNDLSEICAVSCDAPAGVDVLWLPQGQSHPVDQSLHSKGKVWAHGSISGANTSYVSFLNTLPVSDICCYLFISISFSLCRILEERDRLSGRVGVWKWRYH